MVKFADEIYLIAQASNCGTNALEIKHMQRKLNMSETKSAQTTCAGTTFSKWTPFSYHQDANVMY